MKRLIVATFAMLVFAVAALAQSAQFGRLVGTISSPDGVIAGATVVVKSNATGKEQTVTTSGEGTFSIPALDPGVYTVTVTSTGFKTLTVNEVKIDTGRDFSFNQTLEVGDVSASVTITAGTEIVNSTSGELTTTVSPRQVLELPLNGRNPLGLVGLQAGAAPNRGNGSEIINGGRTASTDFTRDGINVQDVFIRNGFVPDTPTVDNTGEFTVGTLNAGAEQGFGSSHIQLVTPRGGRDFHGALFLYNRNAKFAANTFFNNAAGRFVATDTAVIQGRANVGDPRLPKPFLNRNQFGGKISGPIPIPYWNGVVRNKAFFFFSTEKYILHQQTSKTTTIFLPNARNGIFSYRPTGTPGAGQCITFTGGVCTVNVLNGAGMTGAIPGSSLGVLALDPLIQSRFISKIPTQGNRNDIGDQLNTTGYGFNQSDPEDRREFTGRVDVELNSQHSINGVYRFNETVDARTDIDTTYNPVARANTDAPVKFMALAWNWTPTSVLTNELRGGFQFAPVAFNNLAFPTANNLLSSLSLATMPEVLFRNQGRNVKTFNVQDNATYLWGNHSLRFGGTWQQYKVRSFNFANVGVPTYAISTTGNGNTPGLAAGLFPGGISTANLATANVLRYLMGGVIGSGSIAANVTDRNSGFVPGARLDRNLKYTNIAFYIADQWRVNNRLTLNLGLRYELYTPLRSTDGLYLEPVLGPDPVASVLDPNGTYDFVGRNSGHPGNFTKLDKNNFAPIVSFAYSTGFNHGIMKMLFGEPGKTVLRGGFRVGYVNDEYIRSIDNAVGQNAGLTTTASARTGGTLAGSTFLNDRFSGVLSPTVAPPFITPPITYLFNNQNATNFATVFGVDPNLQVQREYEYNIGIQRELPGQLAFEARYVGGWSNDLVRTIDYNQVDITNNGFGNDYLRAMNNFAISGSINGNVACLGNGTCRPLTVIPGLTAAGQTSVTTNVQAGSAFFGLPADLALNLVQNNRAGTVRIMPNPSTGVGNLVVNAGMQRYNALQLEVRRRLSAGLYFQANYTFQKIMTDVTDDGINQTRVAPYLDNNNKHLDYARASFDTAQFFNFNAIYELPFGKGKRFLNEGTWLNRLVGGWQITSIVQINTGAPLSITDARGTLNRAGRSGNQTAFSNLTKEQIKALIGYRNVNGTLWYIDPSVVSANGTAANGYGSAAFPGQVFFNVGPNATGNIERFFITGPSVWNWDAGLIKNISITEKTRLQLRAEAFNVTNSTRFGTPTFAIGSANFGKLTSAFSPRIMQFVGRFEF